MYNMTPYISCYRTCSHVNFRQSCMPTAAYLNQTGLVVARQTLQITSHILPCLAYIQPAPICTLLCVIIVLRLWKVLNVKSADKGRRKRDTDMAPVHSMNDANVLFLREVYGWLVEWEGLQQK